MTEVNADGTTLCPLCRRLVRTTVKGLLYLHFGRELSVAGYKSVVCKASMLTPAEAREMARREESELDALRMRAHP